jgi:hypothetical protein
VAEPSEVCDGIDHSGQTCQSLGFGGGTLGCATNCAGYDTANCTSCGNNAQEGSEVCDGLDLNGQSCMSMGFTGGTLGCNGNCTGYDVSGCTSGLTCDLQPPSDFPPCDVNSPTSCACEGCTDDGVCYNSITSQIDDCVCADCHNDATCMGNCDNNGACNPYVEGCNCADCADHPECTP